MKPAQHPHIEYLLKGLALEERAQQSRYSIKDAASIKQLKREGLAIYPIKTGKKSYGFAEYPELQFKAPISQDTSQFRGGNAIEIFFQSEAPIKGILLSLDGSNGEVRIYAPDFPDWIDEHGVGIKLSPDTRTTEVITQVLQDIDANAKAPAARFFSYLFKEENTLIEPSAYPVETINFLNESQQTAVAKINGKESIVIIHGPPGTGKTTTLVQAIKQLAANGEKILVTAPSNAAVDHIALQLIKNQVKTIRIGNQVKMHPALIPHTIEGKLMQGSEQQAIKKMRIQAEAFRKMAYQYKRSFGKSEREQRRLLFQEVKNIRNEIKATQNFYAEKWIQEAQVICGTPIGLYDENIQNISFNTLVIDEAGQCLESLAWVAIRNTNRLVLAGDHLQLPPTLISEEAIKKGYAKSFLEVVLEKVPSPHLLNTQYRMRKMIADFSNQYFYEGKLQTPEILLDNNQHLIFYDTAGTGYNEQQPDEGGSLMNEGEIQLIQKLLQNNVYDISKCAVITPYSAQVVLAKQQLPAGIRVSTVDSFQGQECETIFISLVRSNDEAKLGFLTDYRRMNVALTRAQQQLIVIGDSATFGQDKFYQSFLQYCEKHQAYKSAWELMT